MTQESPCAQIAPLELILTGGDTAGWQQGQGLGPALTWSPRMLQGQTGGVSTDRTGSPWWALSKPGVGAELWEALLLLGEQPQDPFEITGRP